MTVLANGDLKTHCDMFDSCHKWNLIEDAGLGDPGALPSIAAERDSPFKVASQTGKRMIKK